MENTTAPSQPSAPHTLESNQNPRVLRLQHFLVNSYLVGDAGTGTWALVDAGLAPWNARKILKAAEQRFGRGVPPAAIILTHGHFDHIGAVQPLLRRWQRVPVYAHELELPYLTGRSAYPPPDPTVGGGLMARMARLFPRGPIDLGTHVLPLPADGVVPGMPGWRWIHTPGHSPGHVSLFRFTDGMLLAGDAFVTVKQESLLAVLSQKPEVSRPPAYFTPNWGAARQSLQALLALGPEVAATGHGLPMSGERMREQLRQLVLNFDRQSVPRRGRYVGWPAVTDERGVVSIPPPVPDPFPRVLGLSLATIGVLGLVVSARRRSYRARPSSRRKPA